MSYAEGNDYTKHIAISSLLVGAGLAYYFNLPSDETECSVSIAKPKIKKSVKRNYSGSAEEKEWINKVGFYFPNLKAQHAQLFFGLKAKLKELELYEIISIHEECGDEIKIYEAPNEMDDNVMRHEVKEWKRTRRDGYFYSGQVDD